MKRSLAVVFGLVLFTIGLTTLSGGQTKAGESAVRVTGADSMFARIHILSKVFMKATPTIKIEIVPGSLVDIGIAELLDGKADIAMASRKITPREADLAAQKGIDLAERLVGYGGVVIITHPSNPVNDLTVEQVQKIFRGDITRWDQVSGSVPQLIRVVRVGEQHPGTLLFMEEDFLGHAPFASDSTVVTQFPSVMKAVAETPNAICFVRIRDAFESRIAQAGAIKILEISRLNGMEAVAPSRESVADGSYPIRRPYYLYYKASAGPDVVKFADFIVSKGWGKEDL